MFITIGRTAINFDYVVSFGVENNVLDASSKLTVVTRAGTVISWDSSDSFDPVAGYERILDQLRAADAVVVMPPRYADPATLQPR